MRIWGNIPKVTDIYNKQKGIGKVEKPAGASGKKDVLSISEEAKDFQTVMKALKSVPDIRKDKIKEISEKYQSGSFRVESKDIADKVIRSLIDKKI
jgi:negative regulator of flagellin synthesis FlgM